MPIVTRLLNISSEDTQLSLIMSALSFCSCIIMVSDLVRDSVAVSCWEWSSFSVGLVFCARIGAVTTEVFLGWKRHW